MPSFTRTIIVLDQASGTARLDGEHLVGLDLHPDVTDWLSSADGGGASTVIALAQQYGAAAADDAGLSADTGEVAETSDAAGLAAAVGVGEVAALSKVLGESRSPGADNADDGGSAAFVCADRSVRGTARAAGLVAAAHPALLPLLSAEAAVVAARFAGPRSVLERFAAQHGVVPVHFQPVSASTDWALIGVCGSAALADAVLRRLWVVPIDYDPGVEDLVWARIDESTDALRTELAGRRILFAEPGQVLLALGPQEPSEALQLHGAHGHTELLALDPGLLQPARVDADLDDDAAAFAPPSPILEEVTIDVAGRRRIRAARAKCTVVTSGYAGHLDRYTGVTALDGAGPVASRHISHPDNQRVVAQLMADLRAMGYCPVRHEFLHNGVTLANVVADLPGHGSWRIKPAVLERLRAILRRTGDVRDGILTELRTLGGAEAVDGAALDDLPEPALRRELERIVALEPWNPWWKLKCPMAGLGAGLVIVGAHLDSTAGFDPGYSPTTHPAPGRDDNGSGLAAVLSLAEYFRSLAGKLTHTVRFCLFNAEEAGLVGSKAYAAQLKAQRAPVRAVFCMDMIGYNSDSSRIFELHAGYTDPAIRDLSVPLAGQVASAAAAGGSLLPAQVYRGTGYGGAPDRTVFDGAINRSDHAAFHQQGWGAVLASEDFFANLPTEPAPDANPNYHRGSDQTTDTSFARAITCAVGRAATLAAL
jgi:Peptidase family M28